MDYIKQVRIWLKDPKKKSLTLLGIYFVFFVFVFLFLNSAVTQKTTVIEPQEEVSAEQSYKEMTSYNYKNKYTINGIVYEVVGDYVNGNSSFTYNLNKYYYENNIYYAQNIEEFNQTKFIQNIDKLFNVKLYTLIENLTEDSKTTYNDGTISKNYLVDSKMFYTYYYNVDKPLDNKISIYVFEEDNKIKSITIDLTALNEELTKIEIEYSNINNIASLEFNKDNYTRMEMSL